MSATTLFHHCSNRTPPTLFGRVVPRGKDGSGLAGHAVAAGRGLVGEADQIADNAVRQIHFGGHLAGDDLGGAELAWRGQEAGAVLGPEIHQVGRYVGREIGRVKAFRLRNGAGPGRIVAIGGPAAGRVGRLGQLPELEGLRP
jgi:hypothetical protein